MHWTIFGNAAEQAKMTAVNDTDGNILDDPKQVSQFVHKLYQGQASPAFGPKTGKYLPGEVRRDYPWHTGGWSDLGPFTLETRVGDPLYEKVSVLDRICCPTLFSAQLRSLSNNTQPGPDGIPNELLKHLPDEVHQAIHKLFILMWATPQSWKQSSTILLHKRGE